MRKVYGSVGVVFKGSGFYRTDSRKTASVVRERSSNGSSSAKESSFELVLVLLVVVQGRSSSSSTRSASSPDQGRRADHGRLTDGPAVRPQADGAVHNLSRPPSP